MFPGSSSSSAIHARDQGPVPLASASSDRSPESSPAEKLRIDRRNRFLRKARHEDARIRAMEGIPVLRPATWDQYECAGCGIQMSTKMRTCAGCRWAQYCTKECQKSHWRAGHGAQCSPDNRLPVGTGKLYTDLVPEDPAQYSASALECPVREEIPECVQPVYWILDSWVLYDQPDSDESERALSTSAEYHR